MNEEDGLWVIDDSSDEDGWSESEGVRIEIADLTRAEVKGGGERRSR